MSRSNPPVLLWCLFFFFLVMASQGYILVLFSAILIETHSSSVVRSKYLQWRILSHFILGMHLDLIFVRGIVVCTCKRLLHILGRTEHVIQRHGDALPDHLDRSGQGVCRGRMIDAGVLQCTGAKLNGRKMIADSCIAAR